MNPVSVSEYVQHLTGVHAPYNFTPLNEQVYTVPAEYAARVGHDVPFRDAISGSIELEIEAVTPLCVGNEQTSSDKEERHIPSRVEPLRLPDGRYAIAGSSLRGMIRSVVEIIGFGRMQRFDDRHLSFRDLAGSVKDQYRARMTETRSGGFHPLAKAGWLEFNGLAGGWTIIPCDYARVPHQLLYDHSNRKWRAFEERSTAGDKYEQWKKTGQSLQLTFEHEGMQKDEASGTWAVRCTALGEGSLQGTLVFTGQPGPYRMADDDQKKKHKKKVEFIFFDERASDAIDVPDAIIRTFKDVHEESPAWKFLKGRDYQRMIESRGFRVPVFYLDDDEDLPSAIGLSLMFRLPYRNTIADAVVGPFPQHDAALKDDLANSIFGHLSDEAGQSLKSRVCFGTAICAEREPSLHNQTVILVNPNPAFYPAYLEQPTATDPRHSGRLSAAEYKTYEVDKPKIRGWKRYPARTEVTPRALSEHNGQRMNTELTLYPAGTKFMARIRCHNLRPVELGALVWALELGGENELVHSLGMGKPYGYGQVRCTIRESRLESVSGHDVGADDAVAAFVNEMESWAESHSIAMPEGWLNSDRMRCFRALCHPGRAAEWEEKTGAKLLYLTTDDESSLSGNHMPAAHQKIKSEKLVLPAYLKAQPVLAAGLEENPQADQWLTENISQLKSLSNIRDEDEVWRQKGLAERVEQIEDEQIQRAVAQRIKAFWNKKNWWIGAKRKRRQVREIYVGILGESE
ncbi:MAG: TIGR03986 family CRISPR-associated RAMP protein [Wenzhouxiangellaceae bacterium]|nr:TIGR03986 family CRISPR-associated RAMP protein [Wenzhouxiangellaceae bacterium]